MELEIRLYMKFNLFQRSIEILFFQQAKQYDHYIISHTSLQYNTYLTSGGILYIYIKSD